MDGVNVLREPGVKTDDPLNVLVNLTNHLYRVIKTRWLVVFRFTTVQLDAEKKRLQPSRLKSQYIARMPEDSFPTFKAMFNRELDSIESQLAEGVIKILLKMATSPFGGF